MESCNFVKISFLVKPVIKEVPRVVTIKRKTAIIECRVQSIFEPQIVWTKENTVIRESSNRRTRIEQITDVCSKFYDSAFTNQELFKNQPNFPSLIFLG